MWSVAGGGDLVVLEMLLCWRCCCAGDFVCAGDLVAPVDFVQAMWYIVVLGSSLC